MAESLNEFYEEQGIRPVLLTVLCILTFIGSTWTILSSVWAYSMAAKTAHIFNEQKSKAQSQFQSADSLTMQSNHKKHNFFGSKMFGEVSAMVTEDNMKKTAMGNVVSGLLTLAGAVFMWRLKRLGLYIYIIGVIAGIAFPLFLYGMNIIAGGMAVFTGFFGLVFITLYFLNYKSLR